MAEMSVTQDDLYKGTPDAERWMALVDQAIRYKEDYSAWRDWATYRAYLRGDFPALVEGQPYLPYNLTYGIIHTVIPNIYFRNPYIMVSPRMGNRRQESGADVQAKMVESVVNWLVQEMNVKKVAKMVCLDTMLSGRGIIKLGYDSEFGYAINEVMAEAGIEDATATSVSRDGRERIEYNNNIKPGMPWVGRVDPDMFLVPFGANELDSCEWVDHICLRPVRDVRLDPKYSGVRDLKGTHIEKSLHFKNKARFYRDISKEIDIAELHEISDAKRRERLVILPTGPDETRIIRGPLQDVLQIEGLPYIDLSFNDDPEFYWSTPDVKIFEPQQLEVNEARTQAMLHRRVALLKMIVQEGVISPVEAEKLLSAKVMPLIFSKEPPGGAKIMMLQPHIPPDLLQWPDVIRSDVRELVGLGRQSMGEVETSSRRTATEAQIVQMAKEIRMDEKRDAMADLLQNMMRKVMQIVFKFWTKERVAQIVGFDGAIYWVKYSADAIRGEYTLKVDIESMTPQTKQLRRQDLMQMIQALGSNPRVNIDYLMQMLLREFDWLDLNRVLPTAQQTTAAPIPYEQFSQGQQKMLANPNELRKLLQRNMQMAPQAGNPPLGAMPRGG